MKKPLDVDELYFTWLYSQVGDTTVKNPTRTYWRMLKQLYDTKFVCVIPRDGNRIEDGKELRYEFVDQSELSDVDHGWLQDCTIFEVIISLSRRFAFEAGGEACDWFWEMINNLGLRELNDKSRFDEGEVQEVLDRLNYRHYEPDGRGGLFPLRNAHEDQREVELWYQMSAYILEKI